MYSNIILLLILVLPIPVLIRGIRKGENPYRVILEGAVLAGIGIAAVFIIAQMSGHSLGDEVEKTINSFSKILAENEQMAKSLGLENSSKAERIESYKALYNVGAQMMPAILLIMGLIVSYLEGLLFGRILKKDGVAINRVPPLREFTLPRTTIMGWFVIFILSWILKLTGFSGGEFILLNVNVLFEFTFALQGMALIFLFAYMKRIPKVVPVIVLIIMWFTSIGQMIMFFAGIVDLLLGLRKRIKPR